MKSFTIVYLLLVTNLTLEAQTKRDTIKGAHGTIEIDASFPGGVSRWKNYLEQNFREHYVRCKLHVGNRPYTETAVIQFKILKDGKIGEVYCRNSASINNALQNEAVRLIKRSPGWIPAERNGRVVNAYKTETISITVSPLYL